MDDSALARYQRMRPWADPLIWLLVMTLLCALETVVAIWDARSAGRDVHSWEIVAWEASSHIALLVLVPGVIAWEARHPLRLSTLRQVWPWHLLASLVFSVAHVALMVALRTAVYALWGQRYDFGPWWTNWLYEYLKDVRAYALLLMGLQTYRLVMLRWQGEARVLDEPEPPLMTGTSEPNTNTALDRIEKLAIKFEAHGPSDRGTGMPGLEQPQPAAPTGGPLAAAPPATPPPAAPRYPERFLVRKLRHEFLIAARDIAWVQAQANYVALHVAGHDYLLRDTMTRFAQQLDPARFVRVHRSYLVNLDAVAAIEPLDSGDAKLLMRGGGTVPCSRRYRGALRGSP